MDRGYKLDGVKQWRCDANPNHVLGILKRVESRVQVDGATVRYHTTQVMLFKDSIDLDAEMPDEIDVVGVVEGLMLTSMTWRCTCCGTVKKWHPGEEALMWLRVQSQGAGDR